MAKTVLITGASSGIGLECAKQFLNKNWNVISFDLNICPIKDVESYIVDIRNEKDIKSALQNIRDIDVLINNAGVYGLVDINNGSNDEVEKIIDTNLKGTFLVTSFNFY